MQFKIKKLAAFDEIKKFTTLSASQIESLEDYVKLLLQENDNFNFIGKSTIENLWERHILDSAQLLRFIENKNLKFFSFLL